jgi:RimJ/RimL family protein N-acetyltransferase
MFAGELVTLRPVRPDDYPKLYEWRIDMTLWMQMSSRPPYPTTYADFLAIYDRITVDQDYVEFAVDVDGGLVGRCGMFSFDHLARSAEVGLSFGPEHRGKGYGREALRVLLDYGFTYRNLRRVWLETTVTNEAALRAYAAAGFVEEGRLREHAYIEGAYVDAVRMAVLRADWERR